MLRFRHADGGQPISEVDHRAQIARGGSCPSADNACTVRRTHHARADGPARRVDRQGRPDHRPSEPRGIGTTGSQWQQLRCSTSWRLDFHHLAVQSLHSETHAQARSSSSTQAERRHAHGEQSLRTQPVQQCQAVNSCSLHSHS